MSESGKRKLHPALQTLLAYDVNFTQKFVLWANQFLPLRSLRIHYKVLEISCHGVPWFACWLAFLWLWTNQDLVEMQINMLLGLLIDIIFVALIKAYTRRRRPVANTDDMLGQMGPDKFSFPSGHASRAVFIAYFLLIYITAGVLLGIFQGWLLGLIWLNQSTAVWIWTSLSDEKLDGGEYHV